MNQRQQKLKEITNYAKSTHTNFYTTKYNGYYIHSGTYDNIEIHRVKLEINHQLKEENPKIQQLNYYYSTSLKHIKKKIRENNFGTYKVGKDQEWTRKLEKI